MKISEKEFTVLTRTAAYINRESLPQLEIDTECGTDNVKATINYSSWGSMKPEAAIEEAKNAIVS